MKGHHHHAPAAGALPAELLKRAGLKRTRPREAILRHLVKHHGPFSAGDLHRALKDESLDTVTTYRCLTAFEEAGLVRRCDFGDGTARYEYGAGHHHHHVICVECRRIENLDDCEIERWEKKVRGLGYTKVRHVLEFTGVCRDCAAPN